LAGIRVRISGMSNESVTTLSARSTVGPSRSVDVPTGTIGRKGAVARATTSPCCTTAGAGEETADAATCVRAFETAESVVGFARLTTRCRRIGRQPPL